MSKKSPNLVRAAPLRRASRRYRALDLPDSQLADHLGGLGWVYCQFRTALQLPDSLYLQNDLEKPFPPSSAHQSSPNLRLCTD